MPANLSQRTQDGLISWGQQFSNTATPTPTTFNLTTPQLTQFDTLLGHFQSLVAQSRQAATKTTVVTADKQAARVAFIDYARQLVKQVDAAEGLTTGQLLSLGMTVPKKPSAGNPPNIWASVEVLSVSGTSAQVRISEPGVERRARPAKTNGAAIFTFIGEDAPIDTTKWSFALNATKVAKVWVAFPPTTPPGTKVWFLAAWYNQHGIGPLTVPAFTFLPGSPMAPDEEEEAA